MAWEAYLRTAVGALRVALGSQGRPGRGSIQAVEALAPYLPYVLHPVPQAPDRWIWLNRQYQPLGADEKGCAKYEDYTGHHVDRIDPRILLLLERCHARFDGPPGRGLAVYLYDGRSPGPRGGLGEAREYLALLETIQTEPLERQTLWRPLVAQ